MPASLLWTRAVKALGVVAVATGLSWLAAPHAAGRPAQAPATAPTTGTSAISGVVTDAATGAPIAGASVLLINVRNESGQFQDFRHPSALTDAKGRFVFADLPSAFRYEVAATRVGYAVGETRDGVSIKLADGEWKRDVSIAMSRPSSISGRVIDERGEPVVGTAVRIFGRRTVAGHELILGGATSSTDDRGVYRMAYLEPGRYYVAVLSVQSTVPGSVVDGARVLPLGGLEGRGASPPPANASIVRGASIDADGRHRLVLTSFATPPAAGGGAARAYPPIFYPNARTIADAQLIDVPANASTTRIDFQLAPVATSTVSGRISGATRDVANMVLRLMPPGDEHLSFGSEVATSVVEADGTFTFLNVPRGDYTLIAGPVIGDISTGGSGTGRLSPSAGFGGTYGTQYPSVPNTFFRWMQTRAGSTAWGRTPVSVAADLTGVDFPLHESTSIGGRVVVDDPSQLRPGEQFGITLEPATADPSLGAFYSYTRGDAHEFSMTGLRPARYLLRPQPSFGWRITSVIAHGVDLIDAGIDAAAGQSFDDIVVSITKTGATLSGTVHTRSGAPAAAAVILFPADPKAWVDYGFTPDRLQSVKTDSAGGYRLALLREGDYLAIAVPVSQARAWIDARFLAAASAQATRVTFPSTAAKTQDLVIMEVIVK